MTPMVERLAELRKHVEHLKALAPRIGSVQDLEGDLSLHNDVMFSLLMVAQLVIDIAGELAARSGQPFEDYTSAVRALGKLEGFPPELVDRLARLPGFRNVLIHDYAALDLEVALQALEELDPVETFLGIVATRLRTWEGPPSGPR